MDGAEIFMRCRANGCPQNTFNIECNCDMVSTHRYCEKHLLERGWVLDEELCWCHRGIEEVIDRLGWDPEDMNVKKIRHGIQEISFNLDVKPLIYTFAWTNNRRIEVSPDWRDLPGHVESHSNAQMATYSFTTEEVESKFEETPAPGTKSANKKG